MSNLLSLIVDLEEDEIVSYIDKNYKDITPDQMYSTVAIKLGKRRVLDCLTKYKLSKYDDYLIYTCIFFNRREILEDLYRQVKHLPKEALYWAIEQKNVDIFKWMEDPWMEEYTSGYSSKHLYHCIVNDSLEILIYLLEQDCPYNVDKLKEYISYHKVNSCITYLQEHINV